LENTPDLKIIKKNRFKNCFKFERKMFFVKNVDVLKYTRFKKRFRIEK
jgi:hypothetical protein